MPKFWIILKKKALGCGRRLGCIINSYCFLCRIACQLLGALQDVRFNLWSSKFLSVLVRNAHGSEGGGWGGRGAAPLHSGLSRPPSTDNRLIDQIRSDQETLSCYWQFENNHQPCSHVFPQNQPNLGQGGTNGFSKSSSLVALQPRALHSQPARTPGAGASTTRSL